MLVDKIYRGLVKEASRSLKQRRRLTASTITACRRANYYSIKNVVKAGETDPVLLSKLRDGQLGHLDVIQLLKEVGVEVLKTEFDVYCGGIDGIYARVDALVRTEIPNIGFTEANLEIKTMSDHDFRIFLNNGIIAFPAYYAQCQVILGSEPELPLILLAKNKNTSEYAEELVKKDNKYISELLTFKRDFDNMIEKGIIPERDYEYTSVECKGCQWRFKCWFQTIRRDILIQRNLSKDEMDKIEFFLSEVKRLRGYYINYLDAYDNLVNYIALLHNKHAVKYIKLDDLSSVAVHSVREYPDLNYIRSILTDDEYNLAFSKRESDFFKINIKNLEVNNG